MVNRRPRRSTARTSTIENLSSGASCRFNGVEELEGLDAAVALEVQNRVDQLHQEWLVALLAEDTLEDDVISKRVDDPVGIRHEGGVPSEGSRPTGAAMGNHLSPPPGELFFLTRKADPNHQPPESPAKGAQKPRPWGPSGRLRGPGPSWPPSGCYHRPNPPLTALGAHHNTFMTGFP